MGLYDQQAINAFGGTGSVNMGNLGITQPQPTLTPKVAATDPTQPPPDPGMGVRRGFQVPGATTPATTPTAPPVAPPPPANSAATKTWTGNSNQTILNNWNHQNDLAFQSSGIKNYDDYAKTKSFDTGMGQQQSLDNINLSQEDAMNRGLWNPENGTWEQYQQGLQNQYKQQYGQDWTQPINYSKYESAPADMLFNPTTGALGNGATGLDPNTPGGKLYNNVWNSEAQQWDPTANNGHMDTSHLPTWTGGDVHNYDKYGGLAGAGVGGFNYTNMKDNNAVIKDPFYGNYTVASNLKPENNSTLGTIASMIPMAVATIASGGALSPMMSALMHSSPQLMQIAVNAAAGQGINLQGLASAGISAGGAAMGLPSWATSGANTALQAFSPQIFPRRG